MRFKNKTVVITGSGAGIGKAAAIQFAQEGANVVINSMSPSGAAVLDEMQAKGWPAIFVQADVSVAEGAEKLISAAVEAFGGIDVLANVAGIVANGSVEDCTEDEWDRSMQVNVKSVYLTSKLAMPYLRRAKGVIVNITSTVAVKGVAARAAYSATKGAVLSLSKSMAAEYVQEGIRVNCVCPGTTVSPSFMDRVNSYDDPEQAMKNFIDRQPMGRLGEADEIARAILFAADPGVTFMTGANIVVDGAMTL